MEGKLRALLFEEIKHKAELIDISNGDGSRPPLPSQATTGTGGGMEPRIAKLEAQMEHALALLAKLDDVPVKLAVIEERARHLPTKDELGTKLRNYLAAAGTIFAIVGVVIGLVFKFFGHP